MDIVTINEQLQIEINRLRSLEHGALELGRKMAEAEAEYEKAIAREIATIQGAANKAERIARGNTADQRMAWRLAEVIYKANSKAQDNSRQILSVLQSRLKYME